MVSSKDPIFEEIRDLNFSQVGKKLNSAAKRLNQNYDSRHQAQTVKEIKSFIGKLGNLQSEHKSLQAHTNITEHLMNVINLPDFLKMLEAQQMIIGGMNNDERNHVISIIEEFIYLHMPLEHTMRLICLMCIEINGFKPKLFDFLRKELIITYGYQYLPLLYNLEQMNLFFPHQSKKNSMPQIRKQLNLIVDYVEDENPKDIAFSYSGYAPISIRLIEYMLSKPFEQLSVFEEDLFIRDQKSNIDRVTKSTSKRYLVTFVGGCTQSEISCLRVLGRIMKCQFTIITTCILNGDDVISSAQKV